MAEGMPDIIGGRYKPIRLIGQGGMGAVYEVEHTHTGDRLALKLLLGKLGSSAQAIDRFRREARVSARIKSDHIVRVTDADVAAELLDAPFLVMELLEGEDLERHATGDTPTKKDVLEWMRQVGRALDKAHKIGVVHRDLKPENLFLTRRDDGTPVLKILDFGIAKVAEDGGLSTTPGQILGTPRYMAPEQAAGDGKNIGPHTDLYALALIVFRLLRGEHYYRSENVVALLGEILHHEVEAPSARGLSLGAAFDAWFLKACARAPEDRFGSAHDQMEALAESLGLPRVLAPSPFEDRKISRSSMPAVAIAEAETMAASNSHRPTATPNDKMPASEPAPSAPAKSNDPARVPAVSLSNHDASVSIAGLPAPTTGRRVALVVGALAVAGAVVAGVVVFGSKGSKGSEGGSPAPSPPTANAPPALAASAATTTAQPAATPNAPASSAPTLTVASAAPSNSASVATAPRPIGVMPIDPKGTSTSPPPVETAAPTVPVVSAPPTSPTKPPDPFADQK